MAKILIVDDSSVSRRKLKQVLESAGNEIAGGACDGDGAFGRYGTLQPGLVTMDIAIPGADGIAVLKMILEAYPDAKLAMVTALGKDGKVIETLNAGEKYYITKPYEDEQIISSIKEALEQL